MFPKTGTPIDFWMAQLRVTLPTAAAHLNTHIYVGRRVGEVLKGGLRWDPSDVDPLSPPLNDSPISDRQRAVARPAKSDIGSAAHCRT
jgi:hypothetical protein